MSDLRVYFEVKGSLSEQLKKFFEPDQVMFDSDDRVTAEVATDWDGFKNGKIREILKLFNKDVYVGISFITESTSYTVTDFDGSSVPQFEDIIDRRKVYRYVKKRLNIISEVNKNDGSFEVKRYLLNLRYVNPVVKVLDVYSVGSQSGITVEMFK